MRQYQLTRWTVEPGAGVTRYRIHRSTNPDFLRGFAQRDLPVAAKETFSDDAFPYHELIWKDTPDDGGVITTVVSMSDRRHVSPSFAHLWYAIQPLPAETLDPLDPIAALYPISAEELHSAIELIGMSAIYGYRWSEVVIHGLDNLVRLPGGLRNEAEFLAAIEDLQQHNKKR